MLIVCYCICQSNSVELPIKLVLLLYIIIKILIKLFFQMSNKLVDEITLTTDSIDIERINQFNILGFTLISHLIWIKHIDKIANRCSRTIGLITKLEHIQTRKKIACYSSIILPHTNYFLLI